MSHLNTVCVGVGVLTTTCIHREAAATCTYPLHEHVGPTQPSHVLCLLPLSLSGSGLTEMKYQRTTMLMSLQIQLSQT